MSGWYQASKLVMKHSGKIALVVLMLSQTSNSFAAACIDGHPSIEKEFNDAVYVIDGKISHVRRDVPHNFEYQGKRFGELVDYVTVRVIKSYKGPAGRDIVFRNSHDSAAVPISVGDRYLLFLHRNEPVGDLLVDTCGSSQPFGEVSKSLLATLVALSDRIKRQPR